MTKLKTTIFERKTVTLRKNIHKKLKLYEKIYKNIKKNNKIL